MSRPNIWTVADFTAADYEPTDLELASNGINTYPSDPGDSPSYDTLTSPHRKATPNEHAD